MTVATEHTPRNKRPVLNIGIMIVLALAVLGAVVVANSWNKGLVVKDISTRGNKILTSSEIVSTAGIEKGQKLYSMNLDAARKRVESNPYVLTASLVRDVPGRVTIVVQERVPIALLHADRHVLIDSAGIILPEVKEGKVFDLPFLTGVTLSPDCKPGTTIHSAPVREALSLLSGAQRVSDDLFHRISEVHVASDGELLCYTSESGVPVMFGQGSIPEKLAKFDSFWKQEVDREGVQTLQYVDLRFEDQVVARWNQQ